MKPASRFLLAGGGLLLLPVLVLAGGVAEAFLGNRPLKPGPLTPTVQVIQDQHVGVGAITSSAGMILVDCGVSADGAAIQAALGGQPVAAIFLSHGHSDHVAGCPQFPGAAIYALSEEVAHVEGRAASHGPLPGLLPLSPRPFQVTRALTDGETVMVGETAVTALWLPGHTAGSAAYLIDGVLFLGDAARSSSAGQLRNAPWVFSDDLTQSAASLQALARRLAPRWPELRYIVLSHTGTLEGSEALRVLAEAARVPR